MKTRFPIKKIIKLNIWLTLNTILFFAVVRFLNPKNIEDITDIYEGLIFGTYILLLISFGNLGLFLIIENLIKRGVFEESKTKKHRVFFFICSYSYAILITLSTILIHKLIFDSRDSATITSVLLLALLGIMMNTYILVLQHYVMIQEDRYKIDLENSNLRAVNFEAANQLLKQQIQPHFLFNALNILKSLYKRNTSEGENYLIYLSNFLRASLSNTSSKITRVKEEIELCKNYINMQKIRFGESLQYSVVIPDATLNNEYIPSFSIQPLIENAIKHNELTEEQPLVVNIMQVGDWIQVSNSLKIKSIAADSTGVGLSNLSERYKLLSGEDLIIEEDENTFSVKIKLLDRKILEKH